LPFLSFLLFLLPFTSRERVVIENMSWHQTIEGVPDDPFPRSLFLDRDSIYGNDFRQRGAGIVKRYFEEDAGKRKWNKYWARQTGR
jgi:hypothetical protein